MAGQHTISDLDGTCLSVLLEDIEGVREVTEEERPLIGIPVRDILLPVPSCL